MFFWKMLEWLAEKAVASTVAVCMVFTNSYITHAAATSSTVSRAGITWVIPGWVAEGTLAPPVTLPSDVASAPGGKEMRALMWSEVVGVVTQAPTSDHTWLAWLLSVMGRSFSKCGIHIRKWGQIETEKWIIQVFWWRVLREYKTLYYNWVYKQTWYHNNMLFDKF
jgi:hypothetical protein